MKVGDYVRTKYGKIFKWNNLCTTDKKDYEEHTRKILFIEDEIKSSPNIIDLIEVGDYLNGWRVNEIERNNDNKNTIIKIGNTTFNVLENEEIYTPVIENDGYNRIEKLKSIVTKEKFSQMEYMVGE